MTTKITEKNISNIANAGVQWQSVVVADGSTGLTTVAGRGYFINTTSGTITVTLPTSANVGDVVVLKDYARTWGTNNVTIASTLFDGTTNTNTFSTNGQTVTLVRMDNTRGWSLVNEDSTTNLGAEFIIATGGTITTSGDFKIHSFTGDGSFVVASIGNASAGPTGSTIDFMVVAGGGSGGTATGGGGGAGGLRTSINSPVTATTYPITIGGGGAGVGPGSAIRGNQGSSSVFNSITSAGGGGGGGYNNPTPANATGGSGGSGGGHAQGGTPAVPVTGPTGGTGNTPPTNPPQGNPGSGMPAGGGGAAGAGGGAATAGVYSAAACVAGVGGAGFDATPIFGTAPQTFYLSDSPNAGTVSTGYFAGGGGGSSFYATTGNGGIGGGGRGGTDSPGTAGIANSGGGAGGGNGPSSTGVSAAGGSGIVLIKYKFQ